LKENNLNLDDEIKKELNLDDAKKTYSEFDEVEIYNIFREKLEKPLGYLRKDGKEGPFLFGSNPTIV
jgi:hypothetical protein